MPMYMDRHDLPGVTPEAVAGAHARDEEIQDRYGVKYHTYWFDPGSGSVFCLAEGPSADAVVAVHREGHGQLASTVIELDTAVPLNSYFGAMPNHPVATPYSEPAMRAIVFTDIRGSVEMTHRLGDDGAMRLVEEHDEIVRTRLTAHSGREVKHTGDGIMAAFTSVAAAVAWSVEVQRALGLRNQDADPPLGVGIGISAGEPVTGENADLFGAAVQLAARLCASAEEGAIVASIAVRELCIGKPFRFSDRGLLELKGLPEPTRAYSVDWSPVEAA